MGFDDLDLAETTNPSLFLLFPNQATNLAQRPPHIARRREGDTSPQNTSFWRHCCIEEFGCTSVGGGKWQFVGKEPPRQ